LLIPVAGLGAVKGTAKEKASRALWKSGVGKKVDGEKYKEETERIVIHGLLHVPDVSQCNVI
jgi:hypothetical protein